MEKTKLSLAGKRILITGAAGFIGAALAQRLLACGHGVRVLGLDAMNAYYDVALKKYRLQTIAEAEERHSENAWTFVRGSIADEAFVHDVFAQFAPDMVVNLAAQAGVRWSIDHPEDYMTSNVLGFFHILEACRHSKDHGAGVQHLVFASSSSVYGANQKVPYATEDKTDAPVSLYAATKKSDELLAHAYAKLYDIPTTGLRFFTVYGPAGRPDMAYFKFTDRLLRGESIDIYNYGKMARDFTYIDDIIEGIVRVMQGAPVRETAADGLPVPPFAVYNIGRGAPVNLMEFVTILQEGLVAAGMLPKTYDFAAHRRLLPMQPGDVPVTYADVTGLAEDYGYRPATDVREGVRAFLGWYRSYYRKES